VVKGYLFKLEWERIRVRGQGRVAECRPTAGAKAERVRF
jgi:hypothetical protein